MNAKILLAGLVAVAAVAIGVPASMRAWTARWQIVKLGYDQVRVDKWTGKTERLTLPNSQSDAKQEWRRATPEELTKCQVIMVTPVYPAGSGIDVTVFNNNAQPIGLGVFTVAWKGQFGDIKREVLTEGHVVASRQEGTVHIKLADWDATNNEGIKVELLDTAISTQ